MVYAVRSSGWNNFRKCEISHRYKLRAEYEIRLYSPLSYNAFGNDRSVLGKWHNLAYVVVRMLNSLFGLLQHTKVIKRVLRIKPKIVAQRCKRKCSQFATNWLLCRYSRSRRVFWGIRKRGSLVPKKLRLAMENVAKTKAFKCTAKIRARAKYVTRVLARVVRKRKHITYTAARIRTSMFRSQYYSCTSVFNNAHRLCRMRKFRSKSLHRGLKLFKRARCTPSIMSTPRTHYIAYDWSCLVARTNRCKRSNSPLRLRWRIRNFVHIKEQLYRKYKYLVRGIYSRTRIRSMLVSSIPHVLSGALLLCYMRIVCQPYNSLTACVLMHTIWGVTWLSVQRCICVLWRYYYRKKKYIAVRSSTYANCHVRAHALHILQMATMLVTRYRAMAHTLSHAFVYGIERTRRNNIATLVNNIASLHSNYTRFEHFDDALSTSLASVLKRSTAQFRKTWWSPEMLQHLIVSLLFGSSSVCQFSFRDIVRIFRYGNLETRSDNLYKDTTWSRARSRNSRKRLGYHNVAVSIGKVGIPDAEFLDLSFFLRLHYDLDLLFFVSFCRMACKESTTIGTALWLYELTYRNFISTYFISAVSSYTDSIYINNVYYTNKLENMLSVGDILEVRSKSVYVDSFIIVCNVIAQCNAKLIRQVWFRSLISILCPLSKFYKIVKKKSFFRFPKWNMYSSISHYYIRPVLYYSHVRAKRSCVSPFMRKWFPHFLNSLDGTFRLCLIKIFKDAHYRWNILMSFDVGWRYNTKMRNVLAQYYAIKRVPSITKDFAMLNGISRRQVYVEASFARFVFCYSAYCALTSVSIKFNERNQGKFGDRRTLRTRRRRSLPCLFSDIWHCKLSQPFNSSKLLFSWEEKKPVAIVHKAKQIPFFLYSIYRFANRNKRRSFEHDTSENAWRYRSLFTVFFLFFKYRQDSKWFTYVMKQQRKAVKAAAPLFRNYVLEVRRWLRNYVRRRSNRLRKKALLRNMKRSWLKLLRRKLRIKRKSCKGRYVAYVDFLDFLYVQHKLPALTQSKRRTWWYRIVSKKPAWLYIKKKPVRVDTTRAWWYSVNPYKGKGRRFYKRRHSIRRAAKQRKSNRKWGRRMVAKRKNKGRILNWKLRSGYIPGTRIFHRWWSWRRRMLRSGRYRAQGVMFARDRFAWRMMNYFENRKHLNWLYRTRNRRFRTRMRIVPRKIRQYFARRLGSMYHRKMLTRYVLGNGSWAYYPWLYKKLSRMLRKEARKYPAVLHSNVYVRIGRRRTARVYKPKHKPKHMQKHKHKHKHKPNPRYQFKPNPKFKPNKADVIRHGKHRRYHTSSGKKTIESLLDCLTRLHIEAAEEQRRERRGVTKVKRSTLSADVIRAKHKHRSNAPQHDGVQDVMWSLLSGDSDARGTHKHYQKTKQIKNAHVKYNLHMHANATALRGNCKKKSAYNIGLPVYLRRIKYINNTAISSLWSVLACKSHRFTGLCKMRHGYKTNGKARRYYINLYSTKFKYKKTRRWKNRGIALGIRGSFYRDSKFLSFFIKRVKLRSLKKRLRVLIYRQLLKYFKLYRAYTSRFDNRVVFNRLRLKLLRFFIRKYTRRKDSYILRRYMASKYSERILTFFSTLGKLHVQYRSELLPIVHTCLNYVYYEDTISLGTKLSYSTLKKRNWWLRKQSNNRSVLLHYLTKNLLQGSDIFTLYGNNLLIFNILNIKLNLCVDYYGEVINRVILDKKISELFPLSEQYLDFVDAK